MHARSFGRKPAITQSIFLFKWALGAKNVLLGVLNNFDTKLFVISLLYRSIWLKIDFSRMPKKKQSHKTPPTACDFGSKTAITQSIFIFERCSPPTKMISLVFWTTLPPKFLSYLSCSAQYDWKSIFAHKHAISAISGNAPKRFSILALKWP